MWSPGRVSAAEVTLQEVRDAHLKYALYCAGNELHDAQPRGLEGNTEGTASSESKMSHAFAPLLCWCMR